MSSIQDMPPTGDFPVAMWQKNLEGKFVWVNQQFGKILNREPAEILGCTDFDLFPRELAEAFVEGDKLAIANGYFEHHQEPHPGGNGSICFNHVVKNAVVNEHGRTVGTQGLFLDVTRDPFRELLLDASVGFAEVASDGRFLSVNEAMSTMLGYTQAEIIDLKFESVFDPADGISPLEFLRDHLLEKPAKPTPINLKRKGNSIVPVLVTFRPISGPSDETSITICTVRDIGTGIHIEKALLKPDTRYLAHIRALPLPVFCVDSELKVSFANKAFLEKQGLASLDEIIGKTSVELYGEAGVQYAKDNLDVLQKEQVLDKFELYRDAADQQRLVRVLKFPIKDFDGKVRGVQGVFWYFDTEQQLAKTELQKALENSLAEYRHIVDHAIEGIIQCNSKGQLLSANPAMLRLLGFNSEHEMLTWSEKGWSRFRNQQDRVDFQAQLALAGIDEPFEIEYELNTRCEDQHVVVLESAQKSKGVSRSNFRTVGFVNDVTESRHNNKVLEETILEKEDLLLMLTHQLRSPAWQAYERTRLFVKKWHGNVPTSLLSIRGLVSKTKSVAWNIDMLAKLARGQQIELKDPAFIKPSILHKLSSEKAEDFQKIRLGFRHQGGRQLTYECSVNDSFSSSKFKILGDLSWLEQCVECLVENAFKYSKSGTTIKSNLEFDCSLARLSIKNIAPKPLQINFSTRTLCAEKKWRAKPAKLVDADGSGLGLFFVDKLMAAHGGRLAISTVDQDGYNNFSLEFPLILDNNENS